jgi:FADH2 O2-dependent halogenase
MPSAVLAKEYDVAILGTGVGGSMLGAILARHGQRVLLIEKSVHPRFAIGESTTPETTFLLRLLAARYSVPEIAHLSSHQLTRRNIGPSCGVKRNFSFVYHRPHETQRPEESTQHPTVAPPYGPDIHLFRQDVDFYMFSVAITYGAEARQRTDVTQVLFGDNDVELRTRQGKTFHARYVVDAGGIQSLLATQLSLRDDPCPLRTRSRTIYTHMMDVLPYDICVDDPSAYGLPSPLSEGTLHHIFDGGWMWVIPFNNHPASTNRLTSVGLTLDLNRFPRRPDIDPEHEFWEVVDTFPQIGRQLEHARAIREWVGTDRLQFSSNSAVGDRYCLLPHAASFVDPLFSSGLQVTFSTINLLAGRLLQASKDGDFSGARFHDIDFWMKHNFNYYDRLISGSYAASSSFELWNAWVRMWMIGGLYGGLGALELLHRCQKTADPIGLSVCDEYPYRGIQSSELKEFAQLLDASERELIAARDRQQSHADASQHIFKLIEASRLWPRTCGRPSPTRRHPGTFTIWQMSKLAVWLKYFSPPYVRKHFFFTANWLILLRATFKDWLDELRQTWRTLGLLLRDFFFDWNRDYEKRVPAALRPTASQSSARLKELREPR